MLKGHKCEKQEMENDAAHTNLTEIKSKHARHVFSFTLYQCQSLLQSLLRLGMSTQLLVRCLKK